MSKSKTTLKAACVESVDVYHFELDDKTPIFRITHRIGAGGGSVDVGMNLNREQAEWVRDHLSAVLMDTDSTHKAWIDARLKPLGVGPLDVEDPASRFAAMEPLPAPYTPSVGDVVRFTGDSPSESAEVMRVVTKVDIDGLTFATPIAGQGFNATGAWEARRCEYVRPATPAERIAAGLDQLPPVNATKLVRTYNYIEDVPPSPLFPVPETGTPPTHDEWMQRLVIAESYAEDARDFGGES